LLSHDDGKEDRRHAEEYAVHGHAGTGDPLLVHCGKSAKEPFCDGSHKGSGKEPVAFEIKVASKEALCGCGRTKKPPFCDGSHAR